MTIKLNRGPLKDREVDYDGDSRLILVSGEPYRKSGRDEKWYYCPTVAYTEGTVPILEPNA